MLAFAWLAASRGEAVGRVNDAASRTTKPVPRAERIIVANPANYQSLLRTLKPGDTLLLASGDYDDPQGAPGLPVFDLHGAEGAPITISGPESGRQAVLFGRSSHNTVRIGNSSHVVIRNLVIDGRNQGGDGVNGQGLSHHITLENLTIRGVGGSQGVVGISTNRAPVWNWTIRGNLITGAGTGMYLGNSDGREPFVAGLIEHNLVTGSIGYAIQIKHQVAWPNVAGMPVGTTATLIRHNVLAKGANSAIGKDARPNLLVGDVPATGPGSGNRYEIYGNFLYGNPTEALFQGEGNIAFYSNLLVNETGPGVVIQPHNGRVRDVRIFGNTIVTSGQPIVIHRGDPAYAQRVDVNAVFAGAGIVAESQFGNIVGSFADAARHLAGPHLPPGKLDLHAKRAMARGPQIDPREWTSFTDFQLDFDGEPRDWRVRGAYAREGGNRRWAPQLERKPCAAAIRDCGWR